MLTSVLEDVFRMRIVSVRRTDFDYAFLLNFWEGWVKWLREVVVKNTRSSIVLSQHHYNRVYLFLCIKSTLILHLFVHNYSWNIVQLLFRSLKSMFSSFNWKVVVWFEAWMVTPLSTLFLSLFLFFLLWFEIISPSWSAAEVTPIRISVNRHTKPNTPEDPTHFTDHPHIGLAHIVSNMEHHFAN